jgi:MFS family permease
MHSQLSRAFHWHWAGVAISQLGSFFTLLAFPWLILQLYQNDSWRMALVLAVMGIPTSVLILLGGALCDRFSSFKLLLLARTGLLLLLLLLAAFIWQQQLSFPLLLLFAASIGSLNALAMPANQAILAQLVPAGDFGRANGLIMLTTQLAQLLGPALAGWTLWWFSQHPLAATQPLLGIAGAFVLEALGFAVAMLLMAPIRLQRPFQPALNPVWQSLWQGLQFCWQQPQFRLVLLYLLLVSFFIQGPLLVILPVLSKLKLGLAANAFGSFYAMVGAGACLGAAMAMWRPVSDQKLGMLVLLANAVGGLTLFSLSWLTQPWLIAMNLLIFGCSSGLVAVAGIHWFQRGAPAQMLGRVMSILLFCVIGLLPASAALAGWLLQKTGLDQLCQSIGLVVVLIACGGMFLSQLRNMGQMQAE